MTMENGIPENPLFHGTNSLEKAQSIMRDRLLSGMSSRFSGGLTPYEGMVYFTRSAVHATYDYALHEEYQGYVLVFDADQISSVLPDEDWVGDFFFKQATLIRDAATGKTSADYLETQLGTPEGHAMWEVLKGMIPARIVKSYNASREARRVAPSLAGKHCMPLLTDEQKAYLISTDWHHRCMAPGGVQPVSCWKILRKNGPERSNDLKKDVANFVKVAERMMFEPKPAPAKPKATSQMRFGL